MRKMNILVAVNDVFIFPTKVMLKSIEKTKNKDVTLDVYVLHSDLKQESREILDALNSENILIHYLRVDDELFENVPIYEYFSKEVYFRLVAHMLLPVTLNRILWIDGDIIVRQPLDEFYYQEFGEEILIACEDMLNGHNWDLHNKFSIPHDKIYFSSGVMLYNLKEMREKVSIRKIFDFIHMNARKIEIVDQDVLNAIFYNDVKVLEKEFKFNYFAGFLKPFDYKKKMKEIVILHFCGAWKPWKKEYPYYGFEEFWDIAKEIDSSKPIYDAIKDSYKKKHTKWVYYEKTKSVVGKVIPLNVIKGLIKNEKKC